LRPRFVHIDPLIAPIEAIDAVLQAPIPVHAGPAPDEGAEPILIPVRYGGEDGPDLEAVAAATGCGVSEVVSRHSAVTYRVTMMGFVPGFGYLWPLDERLRLPRRDVPRTRVPAGSVAIAGAQTAVYPATTPGGWHLLGRTDAVLCDFSRADPFLFEVGRSVRFVPR
jgi:KipI family sensor histidine kinase inhibitor